VGPVAPRPGPPVRRGKEWGPVVRRTAFSNDASECDDHGLDAPFTPATLCEGASRAVDVAVAGTWPVAVPVADGPLFRFGLVLVETLWAEADRAVVVAVPVGWLPFIVEPVAGAFIFVATRFDTVCDDDSDAVVLAVPVGCWPTGVCAKAGIAVAVSKPAKARVVMRFIETLSINQLA
jgi:hypothetical protein